MKQKPHMQLHQHFMPNFIITDKSQLGANENNLSVSPLLVVSLQTSQHGLWAQCTVFGTFCHKGLISLALMDSDKWDKTAHAKSYTVDLSPKCAEYHFPKDGCSSFSIK